MSDLLPMLFHSSIPGYQGKGRLKLIAPVGFTEIFDQYVKMFGHWVHSDGFQVTVEEKKPGEVFQFGNIQISCFQMVHSAGALGYRLEGQGKVFACSGDTEETPVLDDLFRNADLAVTECSFPATVSLEGHLNALDIAGRLQDSDIKKLALVHLYPMAETEDIAGYFRKQKLDDRVVIPKQGTILTF